MEVLEALRLLGLRSEDDLRRYGIRLLKVAMPSPLDATVVKEFADGLTEIFVLEDKSPNLEWFIKDALYAEAHRPIVTGKKDPSGNPLIPLTGTLEADNIVPHLRARLATRLGDDVLAPPPPAPRQVIPLTVDRTPYYCSGCPHNTSTRAPEGELVGAGIGCQTVRSARSSA
jgi:indolepyruvate ferredoxin oxidoreductase